MKNEKWYYHTTTKYQRARRPRVTTGVGTKGFVALWNYTNEKSKHFCFFTKTPRAPRLEQKLKYFPTCTHHVILLYASTAPPRPLPLHSTPLLHHRVIVRLKSGNSLGGYWIRKVKVDNSMLYLLISCVLGFLLKSTFGKLPVHNLVPLIFLL